MRREYWTILLLVVATLGVMGPLCGHEFSNWDDDRTIAENPRLNPPSWASVGYYWSHPQEGLYVPVTYTAWNALAAVGRLEAPDADGVRLNSWVFHAFNVLVHVVNVLLVFAVVRLIAGGDDVAACVGALVFAVHPVQVEAVGWASGTKDLLCGTFALVAVWQYLLFAFARRDGAAGEKRAGAGSPLKPGAHYAIGMVAMVLGMLSKPTAMVVPAVVFVLDVWVVGRPVRRAAVAAAGWLIVAAPLMIVAKLVQPADQVAGAPLWARPMLAGFSLSFYLGKLVWPARLAFDYGWRPPVLLGKAWFYWAWAVPVAVGAGLWWGRRRWPVLWAAGLVFVIGVAPVLGFNRFLFQTFSTVADHYLYLAMLGPAIGAAWVVGRVAVGHPRRRAVLAGAGVVTVALAVRAAAQAPVWRDSLTLNANSVAVTPWSYASSNNLGNAYNDVGHTLVKENRLDEAYRAYLRASEWYRESLRLMPDAPPTSENLAMALVRVSGLEPDPTAAPARLEEAARHLQMAEGLKERSQALDPLLAGNLYLQAGNVAKAVEHYERIVRAHPENAEAARRLAEARGKLGEKGPAGTR